VNRYNKYVRLIRHFGDFVTLPIVILIFADLAGLHRLYLVVLGMGAWTLLEYLVHRFGLHHCSAGRRLHQLHQLHHDHPGDPDAERSSLSTPLIAFPMGVIFISVAGVQDGSGTFAGLLLGYLVFITIHFAVHRWPIEPYSWLYSAKMRHLTHHRLENCNYGVTTGFWDIVFRTNANVLNEHIRSGVGWEPR